MNRILMARKGSRGILVGLAMLGAISVIGCAPAGTWSRPGITQAGFERDMAECRRQATESNQSMPFGEENGLERSDRRNQSIRRCMEAKGYQRK